MHGRDTPRNDPPRRAAPARPASALDPWTAALPTAHSVLGYPVHPVDLDAAVGLVMRAAEGATPRLVVTLNPEIVVRARSEATLRAALERADLMVADGIGLVWAARHAGVRLPGRVPGVDLATIAMARGGPTLSVFFLGGRPGVAEAAAEAARSRWGVRVAGARHGYFDHATEAAAVAAEVRRSGAQLLLAGLGERQETFLDAHRAAFGAGALIGVGGTLDVLAGVAHRTPAWTRRWGVEWAWRVGFDPRRWHRLPRLARFVWMTLRAGR
jgi:N-acetylglucosaminyldiphosphoundecaprenol N-acetyl-beta-D-mannosaminyltransferase